MVSTCTNNFVNEAYLFPNDALENLVLFERSGRWTEVTYLFRELVQLNVDDYQHFECNSDKEKVSMSIVRTCHVFNFQFFLRKEDGLHPLDENEAISATSQSFQETLRTRLSQTASRVADTFTTNVQPEMPSIRQYQFPSDSLPGYHGCASINTTYRVPTDTVNLLPSSMDLVSYQSSSTNLPCDIGQSHMNENNSVHEIENRTFGNSTSDQIEASPPTFQQEYFEDLNCDNQEDSICFSKLIENIEDDGFVASDEYIKSPASLSFDTSSETMYTDRKRFGITSLPSTPVARHRYDDYISSSSHVADVGNGKDMKSLRTSVSVSKQLSFQETVSDSIQDEVNVCTSTNHHQELDDSRLGIDLDVCDQETLGTKYKINTTDVKRCQSPFGDYLKVYFEDSKDDNSATNKKLETLDYQSHHHFIQQSSTEADYAREQDSLQLYNESILYSQDEEYVFDRVFGSDNIEMDLDGIRDDDYLLFTDVENDPVLINQF